MRRKLVALLNFKKVNIINGLLFILMIAISLLIILFGQNGFVKIHSLALSQIFWQYQLPVWVAAIMVGYGLALVGAVLQLILRNPLADASILGVSSGSQFIGMLVLFIFPIYSVNFTQGSFFSFYIACVIGAALVLLCFMFILLLQTQLNNIAMIVLLGIGISAIFSAMTALIMVFSSSELLQQMTLWQFGGFINVGWLQVAVLGVSLLIFMGFIYYQSQAFDMFSLGEREAALIGVNISALLMQLLICMALLVAGIVSVAGPIAFVGLVAPHIARFILKENKLSVLMFASGFIGAIIMLVAQYASQTILYPLVIPVGAITALMGAPFLIYLVIRQLSQNK